MQFRGGSVAVTNGELLAIRLGFGLSPVIPAPADGAALLEDAQSVAEREPAYTTAEARRAHLAFSERQKARREAQKASPDNMVPDEANEAVKEYRNTLTTFRDRYLMIRIAQSAAAPTGFGDRLVQFWADHFTIRAKTGAGLWPMAVAYIEEVIRPNIHGSFATLLKAAETHPAMVTFLDQQGSVGPRSPAAIRSRKPVGLNENLAREILELHTLGVDASYTQDDVHNFAKLLTGLGYNPRHERHFFPARAEPGAETVLGKAYGKGRPRAADIDDVLDDLARRPETARHIARKLAIHFVSDDPDPDLVEALVAAWGKDGGDLPRLYEVLISHPALARQFREKVRLPFDFLASSVRALGIPPAKIAKLEGAPMRRSFRLPLQRMGQPWFGASGPDGWSEAAEAWIRPQLLAERISWAMNVPHKLMDGLPDPRGFVDVALGGSASEALNWAVPKAESIREGVGLVLASAEFNRR